MVSERKIGKSFQYDMPGDLVMTYLAEVSAVQNINNYYSSNVNI